MTLRIKILLAGVLTLVVLVGIPYVVAARFLLAGFLAIEEKAVTAGVHRAVYALYSTSAQLSEAVSAWSQWNESYEFIKTKDSAVHRRYVAKNLSDEILGPNKADIFIYVRNNGRLVYGTGFNRKEGTKEPSPSDLIAHLRRDSYFLRRGKDDNRVFCS